MDLALHLFAVKKCLTLVFGVLSISGGFFPLILCCDTLAAPVIPEASLVIYGNVRSSTSNQLLPINSAPFELTDGAGATVKLSGATNPPVRIVLVNGDGVPTVVSENENPYGSQSLFLHQLDKCDVEARTRPYLAVGSKIEAWRFRTER